MKNANMPATSCVVKASEQGKALGYDRDYVHLGLTKREAFAMAAMQGLLASDSEMNSSAGSISSMAIEQADVILSLLGKEVK